MNHIQAERDLLIVKSMQRELDIITAALILTGQLMMNRILIEPGGFTLTIGGPLTGRERSEGINGNKALSFVIDVLDIILVILLLTDKINVLGIFISHGGFSLTVSGPIFGVPKSEVTLPGTKKIFNEFHEIVSNHYKIEPELINKIRKEGQSWL